MSYTGVSMREESTVSNGGDDYLGRGMPFEPQRDTYMTPYERLTYDLANDKKVHREVVMGKRIGFYRIRGELGSGNFSQVKLGVQILTREKVAIKILDKTKLDAKTQRLLSREISSMERLHHPNVIRLYEVVETLAKLYLILEYASEGELFTKISNEGRFQEADARPLFAQIVSAVRHMVGDFGFSTHVSSIDQPLNTFCGSPPYAAPELFRDDSYNGPSVDVWALGILLYFMITGVLPFRAETVGKLKKCILEGTYSVPTYVSEPCASLIRGLLRPNRTDRLTINDLVTSQWLKDEEFIDEMDPFHFNMERSASAAVGQRKTLGGLTNGESSGVGVRVGSGRRVEERVGSSGSGRGEGRMRKVGREENGFGAGREGNREVDGPESGGFSPDELEALRICIDLGITEDLLAMSSRGKALRSSVVGTYHIVLHRIQKRRSEIDNPIPEGGRTSRNGGGGNGGGVGSGTRNGGGKENGVGGKGEVGKGADKKQSKLCVIL